MPILVIRAAENVPDYDNLFDKISELFAESNNCHQNVTRFSTYPNGSLASILEQIAGMKRKPDRNVGGYGNYLQNFLFVLSLWSDVLKIFLFSVLGNNCGYEKK